MFLLFACQAPFGTDRHDLVGFRVPAISVPSAPAGDVITPEAAIIVDGHPWSDDDVDLYWYWVEDSDGLVAVDPLTPIDGFGAAPALTIPEDRRTLGLIAKQGDLQYRAFVEIAEPPATMARTFSIAGESLPLQLDGVDGPDLLLDARQKLDPSPPDALDPGDFVRLTAITGDDPLVRWMGTAGTFFELDRQQADWVAGDLVLDGDEIDDGRSALAPGTVTILALAIGQPGETAFSATDLVIGPASPGLFVSGRFIPTDADLAPDVGEGVRGVITADGTAPGGISLLDAEVVPIGPFTDYGTENLPCQAVLDGPFDPRVLLDGICSRSAIEGVAVVVVSGEAR